MTITPEIDIQTLALVVSLVATATAGVWKLSQVEASLRDAIVRARDEIDEREEKRTRDFAETFTALRQKINDVELNAAKSYVRIEGYYKERAEIGADIKELGDKIEARLARMEDKLDGQARGG